MEDINISEIYQNAITDPTLFSSLDVETLLDKIENQNNHYLDNKTVEIIAQDIFVSLQQLNLSNALYTSFCQRLTGYRVIERVCDLRNGKNTRWIKRTQIYTNKSLTNGGILTNIKITNKLMDSEESQMLRQLYDKRDMWNDFFIEHIPNSKTNAY